MNWKDTIEAIRRHAEDTVPNECCGLINRDGKVFRCDNAAKDKTNSFSIPPHQVRFVERRGGVYGVYHSHVGTGVYLSSDDLKGMPHDGIYIIAGVVAGYAKEIKMWNVIEGKFFECKWE